MTRGAGRPALPERGFPHPFDWTRARLKREGIEIDARIHDALVRLPEPDLELVMGQAFCDWIGWRTGHLSGHLSSRAGEGRVPLRGGPLEEI